MLYCYAQATNCIQPPVKYVAVLMNVNRQQVDCVCWTVSRTNGQQHISNNSCKAAQQLHEHDVCQIQVCYSHNSLFSFLVWWAALPCVCLITCNKPLSASVKADWRKGNITGVSSVSKACQVTQQAAIQIVRGGMQAKSRCRYIAPIIAPACMASGPGMLV